jgi:hypothetical protein
MNFLTNVLGHYRTSLFGLAAAVLSYLVSNHIGNMPIEQTLLSLALLLGGAAAADAAKK